MSESPNRIHKLTIDVGWFEDGEGMDCRAEVEIHEDKLADLVARAAGRHDGKTTTANGAMTIRVTKTQPSSHGGDDHGEGTGPGT